MDIKEILLTAGKCAVCDFIGELPLPYDVKDFTIQVMEKELDKVVMYNIKYSKSRKEYDDFLKRLQVNENRKLKPLYTML